MTRRLNIEIDSCAACPFFYKWEYGGVGGDFETYYCAKELDGQDKITDSAELYRLKTTLEKYPIPEWCPLEKVEKPKKEKEDK